MSLQYLGKEGDGHGNVALMAPSILRDCKSRSVLGMKERTYLGLSVSSSSSIDGPVMKISIEESKESLNLNLKATELRLGLPGSESPERGKKLITTLSSEPPDKKQLFSLLLSKDGIYSSRNAVSGNKRGFSDTIKEFSSPVKNSSPGERNWMFNNGVSDSETCQAAGQGKTSMKSAATLPNVKTECLSKAEELPEATGSSHSKMNVSDSASAPAAKAQVVGWPPVRSFRKNSLATASKNTDEADGKRSPGAYFVKVSMDGAPYLRKVDLKSYSTYQELSLALEKMFSCFTFGKSDASESPGSETKLRASLRGSDYVLTFEDKDGDWMLVGDVPWEMFIESCKRLKIMKGSDAIGLASKAIEVDSKTKN